MVIPVIVLCSGSVNRVGGLLSVGLSLYFIGTIGKGLLSVISG